MHIEPTKHLYLFGGGDLLYRIAVMARDLAFDVTVVTAPRHAAEAVRDSETLEGALARAGITVRVVTRLSPEDFADAAGACALSFGAAWVFTRPIIDAFAGKLFNVHSARLPNDRGAGGYSWQILRDNRFGYCLIHQIDEGLDSGPVVAMEEYLHSPAVRIPQHYFDESAERNEAFIRRFLVAIHSGTDLDLKAQNELLSLYWPRLSTAEQAYIDWHWSSRDIERFICAFDRPYAGAGTFHHGVEIRLRDAWRSQEEHPFHPFQWGIVFRKSPLGLHVAANDGALLVREVTNRDGTSVMAEIRVGDRLATPGTVLDRARSFRPVYTASGAPTNSNK